MSLPAAENNKDNVTSVLMLYLQNKGLSRTLGESSAEMINKRKSSHVTLLSLRQVFYSGGGGARAFATPNTFSIFLKYFGVVVDGKYLNFI